MKLTVKEEAPRRKHGCLWMIVIFFGLYLLIGGIMSIWMGESLSHPVTKLESNTIYRLDLEGTLVEQAPQANPLEDLMGELPGQYRQEKVVGLDRLLSNIALAKDNDKVLGIYLHGGHLSMGPASAKALRDALSDFKSSGKFVVAYASYYGQMNYYVASVADYICCDPVGRVSWDGLSAQKMYYTRMLDKLGVNIQIFKVGTFKAAVEPFMNTKMSDADREQTQQYLHGIWDEMKASVGKSRHIASMRLDEIADHVMSLSAASAYVNNGLVDSLVYAQDMDSVLRTYAGTKDFHVLTTDKMAQVKRGKMEASDKIAVLYAEGQIYSETGDGITDKKIVREVKKILKDKDIKAVVLRVNSPGGSADASEQIWYAVQTLRQRGLPVVVSMGDYAASGGYYIACGSDYIFAEPTTLTGSIGIFGMLPDVEGLRNKIGLDVDGVQTNKHSLIMANGVMKGMDKEEHALMQAAIERGYDLFTLRCAQGRGMTQDAIKQIGEGRVWLGKDAKRLGLVDELGNMQAAVDKAVELSGVGMYKLEYFPEKKSFMDELMASLEGMDTEEERLVAKVRTWTSKPVVMALMPEVKIQ